MSQTTTYPEIDLSKAGTNNFICVFSKIPNFSFFAQSFTMPGITAATIEVPLPQVARYTTPSTVIDYDILNIELLMDENFKEYFYFVEWMQKNTMTRDMPDMVGNSSIILLSNNKQPIIRLDFSDSFPISLSSFDMSIKESEFMTFTVSLKYHYYTFNYLNGTTLNIV